MPHELDKILMSSSQPDFEDRLVKLRMAICQAPTFNPRSNEGVEVARIIDDFFEHRDQAAVKYTREFDKVDLAPEQFLVSKEDLGKSHNELRKGNPKLLASIQQAIKNVRKYQEEIFIANKKANRHPGIKYTPIKRVGICVPGHQRRCHLP
jgi:histidinol dehydrogenase